MSPTYPGMSEKFFQRWELKTPWTGASARHLQFTITTRLGLPGLSTASPAIWSNSPPWWSVDSSAPLFTQVSKTYGRRSNNLVVKVMWGLTSQAQCPLHANDRARFAASIHFVWDALYGKFQLYANTSGANPRGHQSANSTWARAVTSTLLIHYHNAGGGYLIRQSTSQHVGAREILWLWWELVDPPVN